MKVLAVSASPRKGGNSDVLCDQLLKGASENGNDVEKIMLDRCLPGAKEKGIIYGTGTWDKGDVYRHPSFEKAYDMGKTIGGK